MRPPRVLAVSSVAVGMAAALASFAPSPSAATARPAAVMRLATVAAGGPGGVQARGADLVNAATGRGVRADKYIRAGQTGVGSVAVHRLA